jgi:hypothetical protein
MLNSRDISLLRSDVAANCRKWIELCKASGLNVLVTSTVRDKEYQAYLYEHGRTRKGSIVTNSKLPSFHWDKAGLAFDFCKNVKGHEYDDAKFFKDAAAIAKKMGFTWGGDWKSFVDKPHLQWDDNGKYSASDIRVGRMPRTMPLYDGKTTTAKKVNIVNVTLPILSYGAKGASVEALQMLLNGKGFDCGKVDGSFGSNTLAALKRYQKSVDLEMDGYCGFNTWTALRTI